jgi:hypothetical protein
MAQMTNGFDSYQVFYYTGPTGLQAVIQVYASGVLNGRIGFYPDGGPVVPNGTIAPLGTPIPAINYELKRFKDVMGLLRYEKPLYIWFDTVTGIGFVGTVQQEPVGEQEGV